MKQKNFIVTKDKEIAVKLLSYGFKQISEIGGTWVFQNTSIKNFSFEEFDKKKIVFTNILSL